MKGPKVFVISASSDIGAELCKAWIKKGWKLYGTYRTSSSVVETLRDRYEIEMIFCDLSSVASIEDACAEFQRRAESWDVLVFGAGVLEPIGPFAKNSFDDWEEGISINFLRQMRILHKLLPFRRQESYFPKPCVLFFAGGGTNGATPNYTSYAISKLALTKMCEFLDAEIPDTRFAIVGPGWVKTKIHEATLKAGKEMAGENYQKTEEKLKGSEWISMEQVIDCCTWIITSASTGISGRNFSVAHDVFGEKKLEAALEENPHMYKLRRECNSWTMEK